MHQQGRQADNIHYRTTLQYVVSESTTGGKIERVFTKAVIAGGITGFDKDLHREGAQGDIDVGRGRKAQVSGRYITPARMSRGYRSISEHARL